MVVVVLLALALTTLLNALRFEETLENLVEQRLDVVAQEVASDVVVGLDLGLRIEAMDNLQTIIERLQAQVDGVAAVTIHNCDGVPVATTDATGAAVVVPAAGEKSATGRWRRFAPEGIALGLGITNSYGQCAGGVALAYEAQTFYRTRDAVVTHLIWIALGAALLTVPAGLMLMWVFRRRAQVLKRLHADLDAITEQGRAALPELPASGWQGGGEHELLAGYRAARPVLFETAGHALVSTGVVPHVQAVVPGWGGRLRRWWQDPVVQALALTSATLTLSLLLVSALTAQTLRATLLPELAHKGMAQSVQVARVLQRAVDLEIPLAKLVGVDEYFTAVKRDDADLAFLAISDASGAILHAAGRPVDALQTVFSTPPTDEVLPNPGQRLRGGYLVTRLVLKDGEGAALAELRIGHDESALTRPLRESVADLAIVLLVSLLLAFEVMLLVVTLNVTLPLRATLRVLREVAARRFALIHGEFARGEMGAIARRVDALVQRGAARLKVTPVAIRDPRLVGVRLLAFMFVFAEELARPIMPAYFGQLAAGGEGSSFIGAGMVMALHMAVVALAMPLGSVLYHRIGRRRMYLGGALLASLGLLGTGLADNLWQLLLCRALSGLGYAATFVACQGFVIEATNHTNRARGSALMVGGIMLADICGPAIGGILAAWIGHRTTFMLGAGVAVLAAALVTQLMGRIADHEEDPPRITLRTFADTLGNGRFVALLLFAAVPAKLILGGLLFYLVPLALFEFGANAAQTGRVIMLYGLVGLLCGALFAYFTDRLQRPVLALALGGGLTAAGAMPLMGATTDSAVALAVLALGLGQALSIPALVAAALAISQPALAKYGQGPVMAVLRLLERLGGAAGPLLAALLSTTLGVTAAMAAFGAYALVSALMLLLTLRVFGSPRSPAQVQRTEAP
jgi:predicted MFS family arabinose efflux permease